MQPHVEWHNLSMSRSIKIWRVRSSVRHLGEASAGEMGSAPLEGCQRSPAREHSTPTLVRNVFWWCVSVLVIVSASIFAHFLESFYFEGTQNTPLTNSWVEKHSIRSTFFVQYMRNVSLFFNPEMVMGVASCSLWSDWGFQLNCCCKHFYDTFYSCYQT